MNFFTVFLGSTIFMSVMATSTQANYPCKMVVNVPVANLVDTPGFDNEGSRGPSFSRNVPHLQTQLLCNQQVLALEEQIINEATWIKIQALEQNKAVLDGDGKLSGLMHYPGWMRAQDLSEALSYDFDEKKLKPDYVVKNLWAVMRNGSSELLLPFGTKVHLDQFLADGFYAVSLLDKRKGIVESQFLSQLPDFTYLENTEFQTQLRKDIVDHARLFLDMPYVWGGCSPYKADANFLTSLDCSALIYLCYRVCGFEIPRDAHDQFCVMNSIHPAKMQPGDLVFFGQERERDGKKVMRMNHVLVYTDRGTLIEVKGNQAYDNVDNMTDEVRAALLVCETPFEERLGKPLNDFSDGDFFESKNVFIYFRTVFPPVE